VHVMQVSHMYPRFREHRYGITMKDQIAALAEVCQVDSSVISPVPWVPPMLRRLPRWSQLSVSPRSAEMDGIHVSYPRYLTAPFGLLRKMSWSAFGAAATRAVHEVPNTAKVKLVHAHMAIPDGLAALGISRSLSCPFVVTIQATDLDLTARAGEVQRALLGQVFSAASVVISPSPRLTRTLVAQFACSAVTVPYGIHPDDPHGEAGTTRAEFPVGQILLTVARLLRSKGIDYLIRAFSNLINEQVQLHLVIVGDGPEREHLEAIVDRAGLAEHVSFLGALSHRDVLRYMAACDVFVLPSWRETFGLVYLEAMAAGKPIIGVRGQGIDGIIEDGRTGFLVAPQSISELTQSLRRVLMDSELAQAVATDGRALVFDTLTWERTAERTMEIYEQAIS